MGHRFGTGKLAQFLTFSVGLVVAGIVMAGLAPPLAAQDFTVLTAPQDPAYARAIRFHGIQSRLVYVDTLAGDIPMGSALRLAATDGPRSPRNAPPVWPQWLSRGLLAATAAVLLLLLFRRSDTIRSWFARGRGRRRSQLGNTATAPDRDGGPTPETAALLARLRTLEPREQALVALIGYTLDAAARQNALRLARAETARDFLRRLPASWERLSDLRRIVMTEELVQFGGRPLPEKTFEDCLRRAEPILAGTFR